MKEDILNLFLELLEEWEDAEEVIIDDRGSLNDYDELKRKKEEYLNKINKLLDKVE